MMPAWTTTQTLPGGQQPAHPNTAYTAVPVRRTFGQYITTNQAYVHPPPNQMPPQAMSNGAASQPEQNQKKVDWPPSVRAYVQRCFLPENDDPAVPRAELEAKLKEVIRTAADSGTMHTIPWESMPLPQALVKATRHAQFSGGVNTDSPFNPKKRKSLEFANDNHSQNTFQTTNLRSSLEDRISYPDKRVATDEAMSAKSSKLQKDANKRKRRFENEYRTLKSPSPPPEVSSGPVVGTCEILEKKYLRLTAAPIPAKVRPERILRQTLDLLKKKWRKESNYGYICDQFKSMRQDLTVQHLKNDFTVQVYEIHARIALEKGDVGEYNQCQTQLRSLYQLGLKGNSIEFKAYRILYFIHTANRTGLNDTIADLTPTEKKERPIKHALDVRSALALSNYHRFFQLYLDTPNMGAYLMDMFVVRERLAALCNICKAYKPDVKLRFITEELGFESDADAAQFIIDYKGQHLLEDRSEYIAFLTGKAGALFDTARKSAFKTIDIKGQI